MERGNVSIKPDRLELRQYRAYVSNVCPLEELASESFLHRPFWQDTLCCRDYLKKKHARIAFLRKFLPWCDSFLGQNVPEIVALAWSHNRAAIRRRLPERGLAMKAAPVIQVPDRGILYNWVEPLQEVSLVMPLQAQLFCLRKSPGHQHMFDWVTG